MFFRVLFLLLLALNIGVGCWLYFSPMSRKSDVVVVDSSIPTLMLLSEREHAEETNVVELTTAPESSAEIENDRCVSIGPFSTQADMRRALTSLTPVVKHIQFREARATQSRGFWVYLPAMSTREQALAAARQLSSKGIRDYYVVTAGDQQNTISLGLFNDQVNAEKRRAAIATQGFNPQLIARTEELPIYWIDFAQSTQTTLDWRNYVANPSNLKMQSIACF